MAKFDVNEYRADELTKESSKLRLQICSNCCYTYLDLARIPYLEKIIMNVVLALKMHEMFVYYYETTRATLSHDNSHL